jgi:hypothetical protein
LGGKGDERSDNGAFGGKSIVLLVLVMYTVAVVGAAVYAKE